MNNIIKRLSVEDVIKLRMDSAREMHKLEEQMQVLDKTCKRLDGRMPAPYSLQKHYSSDAIKILDCRYWRYMVSYFHLEDYMLSSEYEKLSNQVEHYQTPEFTYENVMGWVTGMKDLINHGVEELANSIYQKLINAKYITGGKTKKRNNNGIDKRFILHSNDYGYRWSASSPTITDDLEKLCYILDGKQLPEVRMKQAIYNYENNYYLGSTSCPYFSIKVCQNNNTHYCLTDETVARLNKIGANGNILGSDVKIKVF